MAQYEFVWKPCAPKSSGLSSSLSFVGDNPLSDKLWRSFDWDIMIINDCYWGWSLEMLLGSHRNSMAFRWYYIYIVYITYGGFHKWGYPKWLVFVRENLTKIDDDWGYPYDSGFTPICMMISCHFMGCTTWQPPAVVWTNAGQLKTRAWSESFTFQNAKIEDEQGSTDLLSFHSILVGWERDSEFIDDENPHYSRPRRVSNIQRLPPSIDIWS